MTNTVYTGTVKPVLKWAGGIKFMLSNSDTEFIRQLYSGYDITEVSARRAINCNGNGRGAVTELIIRNYK
ncbi:MAG: hypothetical protein PUA84_02980 [Oscillospiraceae bacterium]|nr:hypothetical protein [Oscillospiraceae bacterium]